MRYGIPLDHARFIDQVARYNKTSWEPLPLTQLPMTRSWVDPVSAISWDRPIKVHHMFDSSTTAVDQNHRPVADEAVVAEIREPLKTY